MKIAILGSSGFIGSHLAEFLFKTTQAELVLFSRRPSDYLTTALRSESKVKFVYGDFKDNAAVQEAISGADIVYHVVSDSTPATTWELPDLELSENLVPTLSLINMAAKSGVKKIVFCSSGGTVYGLQSGILTEELKNKPFTPHGIIKTTIENFLEYARIKHQISYDIYRIANPYGPRQELSTKGHGVIPIWMSQIQNGDNLTIFGDGTKLRDFIYIEDTVKLLSTSLTRPISQSNVFNIGTKKGTSLNALTQLLKRVTQKSFEVIREQERQSDNKEAILDNTKILAQLPEFKFTDIEDGLQRTWDYLSSIRT